ncbi:hypothetical protein FOI42_RS02160 [Escherichia coli]|nr:hypothetical protein [Escherichia coli]
MNNLLKVFKISVSGTNLDNKMYNQYDDYDSSDATLAPTDAETKAKSIAYLRMQYVTRLLSEYSVPTYYTVEFGTEGTAKTIPSDASIHVGYISYEPFLSTLSAEEQKELTTEDLKTAAAAKVIQDMLNAALTGNGTNALEKEQISVQKTIQRIDNAFEKTTIDFVEYENIYVDVPSLADATEVTYVKL